MDAYFQKLDEINESLDQLMEDRILLKKILSTRPEEMSAVQALDDNMDKIKTLELLLNIHLNVIKIHASISGQMQSPVFVGLLTNIAKTQAKLISFKASEHSDKR